MRAVLIQNDAPGYRASLQNVDPARLPEGDVLVEVEYSTLNYKDSLALTGRAPVVRKFPMVPGIDLAGRVVESRSKLFRPGDVVLVNGFGLGETHWGGYAELARLDAEWLVPMPDDFSPAKAMAVGSAGFSAMLSIMALEAGGITPDKGDILVTGAVGGLGSMAVALLARLGYRVVAATRRVADEGNYLRSLGAADLIDSNELSDKGKPLQKERWAGAIDVAGSHTLVNACAQTKRGGLVAACGLAQGMELPGTVAPFILRGVTLKGIDAVYCSVTCRRIAWARIAHDLDSTLLAQMAQFIDLSEIRTAALDQLAGKLRGRMVVKVKQ
jgi:acrylyl-CoA reductase (NADPH)